MSHKKSKVPHSLIQTRIQQGVQEQVEKRGNADYRHGYETGQKDLQLIVNANESDKIQQLRLNISTLESRLDESALTLSDKDQLLIKEGQVVNRHIQEIIGLKKQLKQSESNLQTVRQEYVMGVASTVNNDFLVHNWRASWKWISNWCFGLIVFFATTPIPPELLAILPENIRVYVIAWIAFCGFAGRYLNQSKGVQSWSLKS
ncbi:DUF7940 domain-containing protein [Acinetobacter johnsonii]|jgi:hypothetical protein|uniref:DUF7940 domain-containing protein n=1 Tax=Acinetobacter johnsonii TaxID=40214 RepID=UPI0010404BB7|nr:hypothetical protein [Acinetobacter johnsonii]QBK69406.1 hypothetical protein E0Z08_07655 [Acinetobacter johnsonii]